MSYKAKHGSAGMEGRRRCSRKAIAFCAALVLAVSGAVGGSVAWLTAGDKPVTNTFEPVKVSCRVVEEKFDENTGVKTNVRVANTSDIPAYIRVRLVSSRTNGDGAILAGETALPAFTPGDGWFLNESDGYYYYSRPVAPERETGALIGSVTLAPGQALEVLAEAIQGEPDRAVEEAWGVTVDADGAITGAAAAGQEGDRP